VVSRRSGRIAPLLLPRKSCLYFCLIAMPTAPAGLARPLSLRSFAHHTASRRFCSTDEMGNRFNLKTIRSQVSDYVAHFLDEGGLSMRESIL